MHARVFAAPCTHVLPPGLSREALWDLVCTLMEHMACMLVRSLWHVCSYAPFCVHACVRACVRACEFVCACARTNACTPCAHARMHTHTHTHTHTQYAHKFALLHAHEMTLLRIHAHNTQSAVGIALDKQRMLCNRFLRASAHNGYVMSQSVLQSFMGAKGVNADEFARFFADLDGESVRVRVRVPVRVRVRVRVCVRERERG